MDPGDRRPRRLRLIELALTGALVIPTVAACGSSRTDYANCVDRNGNVVSDYYCDDSRYYGGGGYFIWMSSTHYSPGYYAGSSITRINPGDSGARSRAGLSGSGKVGGTSVHSGGVGHGSSGGKGSTS